jgi:hypothetical protein
MEHRDQKTMQRTFYEAYFKQILTFNVKTWTLTNRNKRKIQAVDKKLFLIRIEGERTRESIRNEIFIKEVGIQNSLIGLQ